jgi:hypothetical protein
VGIFGRKGVERRAHGGKCPDIEIVYAGRQRLVEGDDGVRDQQGGDDLFQIVDRAARRGILCEANPRPLEEFFGSQRALEAFGDLALKFRGDAAGFARIVHDENRFHLVAVFLRHRRQ